MKYLVLSDIHLGHHVNKAENIINNLNSFFKDYKDKLMNLDIIFLAGDVFDRLLINSHHDYLISLQYLIQLHQYCKDNNIILRILEGTPSHDFKQVKTLSTILDELNDNSNFKYIETLEVEYLNGYSILYIPDEYRSNSEDTYKEVIKLLNNNHLEKVDIVIMHGAFNYQLPIKLPSNHIELNYMNITNYYIHIGHIHTPSFYKDKILAQGSFDRLCHNEEENKGGVLVELNKGYEFLVNKNAMVFKSYNLENYNDVDSVLNYLDNESKLWKKDYQIRLVFNDNLFTNTNINSIKKRYKVNIKLLSIKTNNENKLIDDFEIPETFNITKDNIEELLMNSLNKYSLNNNEINLAKKIIKEVR